MATVIDPGAGSLAQGIAGLGDAAARVIFAKQLREKELGADPAMLQGLVPSARAAYKSGGIEGYAAALGVRPEYVMERIMAFEPTEEQATSEAFVAAGGAQAEGAGRAAKAKVDRDTAEGIITRDIVGMELDNLVTSTILEGQTLDAQMLFNIPREVTAATAAEARSTQAKGAFDESVYRLRSAGGVDRLSVNAERLQAIAETEGLEIDIRTTRAYKGYLDSLDPNSREFREAIIAIQNPAELQHIQFHENLNFQQSLEALRAGGGTTGDKIAETIRLSDAWQKALDRAAEKRDKGDFTDADARNLESLRFMIETVNETGLIFPIDTAEVTGTRRGRIRLEQRPFQPNLQTELSRLGIESKEHLYSLPPGQMHAALLGLDVRTREAVLAEADRDALAMEEVERAGTSTVGREIISGTFRDLGAAVTDPRAPVGYIYQFLRQGFSEVGSDIQGFLNDMTLPVERAGPS